MGRSEDFKGFSQELVAGLQIHILWSLFEIPVRPFTELGKQEEQKKKSSTPGTFFYIQYINSSAIL